MMVFDYLPRLVRSNAMTARIAISAPPAAIPNSPKRSPRMIREIPMARAMPGKNRMFMSVPLEVAGAAGQLN